MHQIRFQLGLCHRPRWGVYSTPPGPLVVFWGLLLRGKAREEKGRRGERNGRREEVEGKGRKRVRKGSPWASASQK